MHRRPRSPPSRWVGWAGDREGWGSDGGFLKGKRSSEMGSGMQPPGWGGTGAGLGRSPSSLEAASQPRPSCQTQGGERCLTQLAAGPFRGTPRLASSCRLPNPLVPVRLTLDTAVPGSEQGPFPGPPSCHRRQQKCPQCGRLLLPPEPGRGTRLSSGFFKAGPPCAWLSRPGPGSALPSQGPHQKLPWAQPGTHHDNRTGVGAVPFASVSPGLGHRPQRPAELTAVQSSATWGHRSPGR